MGGKGSGAKKRKVVVKPFTRMDPARVPGELREAWSVLTTESRSKPAVLRAIYRVVAFHQTWAAACEAERVNLQHTWEKARAYALAGRTRRAIGDGFARIVSVGQDILEEKLLDRTVTDDLSVRDVAAVVTSAGAQLAKTWEQEDAGTQYATALDRLAERLGPAGGSVRLELVVTPADPAARAKDVTPLISAALPE